MGVSRKTALGRRRKRGLRPDRSSRPAWQASAAKRVLGSSKRPSWKLIGLAGIAGVAATGVVVARQRRAQPDLQPDELRERLHSRLAAIGEAPGDPASEPAPTAPGDAPA